ncbi:DEAD/DEAH box helicase family protein [Corallococcus terminator]
MIDLDTARALLDFGKRMGAGHRAEEQLRGAVAIHNILRKHRIAYLADEVGMGKTYVALGALALFRHFDPSFRVLVITPRENIQRKWQKELTNFAAHNVRFDDLRMRALDGRPARPLVSCGNLLELVHETSIDPNRDFFVRMSSFSLALGNTGEGWMGLRDGLRRHLPWLGEEAFDLRNKKEVFKRNFARALCCALPKFDLVIVDEAHNLKHGFSTSGSSRNQVMAEAFGRHSPEDTPDPRLFPGYGSRAGHVLFLSATPLEETYKHVWNQLDLFGLAGGFRELRDDTIPEERKKEVAAHFLVRRVTSIQIAGKEHTKNMYRREWRSGGVRQHDEPITVSDDRQRLIVALVQKKVSELLSGKQFNRSFQIGMLASFESFLETAQLKRDDNEASVFDDAEQSDQTIEREGIDVHDLNRLARSYRSKFGREMPHPKMDTVVDSLASSWVTGKKALVFVRRVASVKELKRKLDERYDDWLIPHLRERIPDALRAPFDDVVALYRNEKGAAEWIQRGSVPTPLDVVGTDIEVDDRGGTDTFFAWFFRGDGPKGVLSGANIQSRFIKGSGAYSTFFADNHVMALLGTESGNVLASLAATLHLSVAETSDKLRQRAARYLSRRAKVVTRASRMEAAQAAALELLRDSGTGMLAIHAGVIWEERFMASVSREPAAEAPLELSSALERTTFFSELRRPERAGLRARIWPQAPLLAESAEAFRSQFRGQVLRAELLAVAARLGHAFIDLYVASMAGRTILTIRRGAAAESDDREMEAGGERLLREYMDLLEAQLRTPQPRPWGAVDELTEIAENLDLILDVNAPDARTAPLSESARYLASLLRQQQPTGGMAGQVNQTLVRQFRMPGYPFVLVTTDLLQEGEDLHTFCSSIHHYGISWTPSAMEQRVGRIDRVRSQSDRRLSSFSGEPGGEDWLQVFIPHLQDTVEVLQVQRVLDRMSTFLRLMHEGLSVPLLEQRRIDLQREMVAARKQVDRFIGPLKSAFPVPEWATRGTKTALAVEDSFGARVRERFEQLRHSSALGPHIDWAPHPPKGALLGTVTLPNNRIQPFTLVLRSEQGHPVVRCISPIGRTAPDEDPEPIATRGARVPSRIGAILTKEERLYDLTIEDDVVLGSHVHDTIRVRLLVRRVTEQADRMEQEHFDDGRDARLDAFEADLRDEGGDGL